jgi:signal transduction histidine kinase
VAAERARIARELHDIVAHSVTVMMLQSAIARRVLPTDPHHAARALDDIDVQGRQAMSELRRMLSALRVDGSPDDEAAVRAEPHGLADIVDLVDGVNRAGVSVTLEQPAQAPRLDPSVHLAAYRIVQEALTNITRHVGSGAHGRVRCALTGDGLLSVEISDDGEGRADPRMGDLSTGHGLLGLRERVAVVGGRMSSGPTADGGFRVTATLPVAGRAPAGGSQRDSVRVGAAPDVMGRGASSNSPHPHHGGA